jgi:hypothetical protein
MSAARSAAAFSSLEPFRMSYLICIEGAVFLFLIARTGRWHRLGLGLAASSFPPLLWLRLSVQQSLFCLSAAFNTAS